MTQLGEIDVEHHHHEQEQHRHGADVDHDQNDRQELGAQQHEQAGSIDEGEDQEQHRCTGLRAVITITAEATHTPANR